MRKIVDQKIYDTEKSNLLIQWPNPVEHVPFWKKFIGTLLFGPGLYKKPSHAYSLYQTMSGAYFSVTSAYGDITFKSLTIDDAKRWVAKMFTIEEFERIFGKLEEA